MKRIDCRSLEHANRKIVDGSRLILFRATILQCTRTLSSIEVSHRILDRQGLLKRNDCPANKRNVASDKPKGLLTRNRRSAGRIERDVIDVIVVTLGQESLPGPRKVTSAIFLALAGSNQPVGSLPHVGRPVDHR